LPLTLVNGPSTNFHETDYSVAPQPYVCLVSECDFDDIFGRIRQRGLEHWADPGRTRPAQINRRDGGRGVYFADPDGHFLEILTRPYGSAHRCRPPGVGLHRT